MRLTKLYFMLWVADIARATAFYKSALGLNEASRWPQWAELRFGDATVALHTRPSHLPQQHTGLGFEVDDLDAACAAVVAAGGAVVAGPSVRAEEGIRVADCADTEGNRFSLSQQLD